jgi:CheY-like chemotaxis protein
MAFLNIDYEVAENGSDGIDMVTKAFNEGSLFDMIFVKLIMPGQSGYEVALEIRALEEKL